MHCLRDLTRGGLATALSELAENSDLDFEIEEEKLMLSKAEQGACELLGIDPIYVANEGRFIALVPQREVTSILEILHRFPVSENASILGNVMKKRAQKARVHARTSFGTMRIWDRLAGDPLPRIC